MRHSLLTVGLIVAAAFFSGCVAESKYRDLEQAWRKSQEQVTQLEARVAELQQQIDLLEGSRGDVAARLAELRAERDQLVQQLEELRGQYEQLAQRGPIVLPTEVDEALRRFAEQHSDLVEYDRNRGVVKFRSDLTFAPGSADLTAGARDTLGQLAQVLNGPVASKYEVRVVGHTDTVPIGRPETRAKHPTNWHLSVHRAIAVRDALDAGGVPAVRTSVGGYSYYRPLVQNTPTGAERNRRVEIYLVPMVSVNQDHLRAGDESPQSPPAEPEQTDEIPLK